MSSRSYLSVSLVVVALLGLYLTSLHSYLLFHSLAEIFSIAVASGIFMFAWSSRRFLGNTYLLFLGIACLFIGGLDLIHTLSYLGMGVFPSSDADLPTQLWIAARYMEGLSFLVAPFVIGRRWKARFVFLGYGLA
ncbi:MAG: MASE3 domain-containing protein, partial [Pseudomonadota bacterium]